MGKRSEPIKEGDDWVELKLDRYVGHRLHLEFTPAIDSQMEVSLITQGATEAIRQSLMLREQAIAKSAAQFAAKTHWECSAKKHPALVSSWSRERSILQAQVMRRSGLAMAMLDGTAEDDHILIRGNSANPG